MTPMIKIIPYACITFLLLYAVDVSAGSEKIKTNVVSVGSKVFETPEAAIKHFAACLAANDLPGVFEACAVNEMDKYNFAAYSRRIDAILPWQTPAPANSDMFREMNRILRISQLTGQIKIMIYSLVSDIRLDGSAILTVTDEMIEDFLKRADVKNIAGLTVVKIKLPIEKETLYGERATYNAKRQAMAYGGDDSTERIVLYKLGDTYYWGGMHLVRYGKTWKIDSLGSSYANNPALGNLEKTTPEQFDAIGDEE